MTAWPIDPAIPRVALVTGGAKRIGRAIALALAQAGFAVGIHFRDSQADADATVEAIRGCGARGMAFGCDLAHEVAVQRLFPTVAAALGPIGVLVNNASTFQRDDVGEVTRASWDAHIEANLRAPFVLTQDFAALLPAAAQGVVVNMLDERVWSLTPHFVSYTVSKAGLWALTRSLALALAPRIRVCGIGPGPALPSLRQTPEQFARQAASVPLGRPTSPEEIARAVLAILALPSYTGQMLALDGGQHLQWHPSSGALHEE